jgi:hypothetical protein
MCKYEIRIDGAEFEQTFTLDELLDAGFLDDYDPNIEVRAKGETIWVIARDYPFHTKEKQDKPTFIVNEDGSVTRQTTQTKKTKKSQSSTNSNYTVNEDGTVTRRNAPPTTSTSSSSSSSSSSSMPSYGTSSNNDWTDGFWGWVVAGVIAIGLALLFNL